jgi:hypothetical protein
MTKEISYIEPAFAPMVEYCNHHGISRSQAYRLAHRGLIETFSIGRRRFVTTASIRSLPTTMTEGRA